MIKIEFPSDRKDIALAISKALAEISAHGDTMYEVTSYATAVGTADSENAQLAHYAQMAGASHEEVKPEEFGTADQTLDAAAVADVQAAEAEAGAQASGKVDEKGVTFDPQMCANAAKPFYASGKNKGQWKKKGGESGPTEEAYDAWYVAQLQLVTQAAPQQQAAETQIDAAAVWKAPAANTSPVNKVPTNAGEFFSWISEMQTAGHLTQANIDAAYPANNITDAAQIWSFPPDVQTQVFAALHKTLLTSVPF